MDQLTGLIEKYKNVALSDDDIRKFMGNEAKIITYSKLKDYDSIEQLLQPFNAVFILFEWREGYGHWVLLIKNEISAAEQTVEYFDPYGHFVDYWLKKISEPFRTDSGQKDPMLSKLLIEYNGEMSWNNFDFQKMHKKIRTCGMWCVLRALLKELSLETFKDLFYGKHSDDLAAFLLLA